MNAQILGGPRNGEIWPVTGPTLLMPKPVRSLPAYSLNDPIPFEQAYLTDRYLLRRDGDAKYFYVLQSP